MSFFFVFLVSWLNSKGLCADLKFELFNIINPTLFILVSLFLVSILFMNRVLKVTTALHSSVSFGFFLKTRQVQMWIFVNMFMEINVWLLNKKPNKSVKLPFSVLKVSRVSREFYYQYWTWTRSIVLLLYWLHDFSFKNPSPSLIFQASV